MRGARHRLLRELAPRHARAARLRDRQSDGWRDYGDTHLGAHRLRRPDGRDADDRRPRAHVPLATRRAAPTADDDPRRRHDRADRRRVSIAFTPEIVDPGHARDDAALRRRTSIRQYGFLDAFNPTLRTDASSSQHGRVDPALGWFDVDYLGIDQGPIVAMIENYRSGLVWKTMRKNPHIVARPAARRLHGRLAGGAASAALERPSAAGCLRRSAARAARWRSACGSARRDARERLEFWGLGREGEVVARARSRSSSGAIPASTSIVQQIPWTAAHEKLLTAFVGDATPDVAQMGNTWIPEFVAMHALDAARPARTGATAIDRAATTSPASGTPTSSTACSTASPGTSTRASCSTAATSSPPSARIPSSRAPGARGWTR